MRHSLLLPSIATTVVTFIPLSAQQSAINAPTALTIDNQDFAVARTTVSLELHAGTNEVLTTSITSQLEPDSVVLRDPSGHNAVMVIEQNYDAGVVTQQWLLEKYEDQTLDFQIRPAYRATLENGETREIPAQVAQGRVIRAGNNPLIEFNGHLQFQLPGTPLFPVSTDGLLLKPTLCWKIQSAKGASFPAELAYITRGMSWQATYNVVMPESSDTTAAELADIIGWVTIQNNSGTDFPQATIQLMAGNVAKTRDRQVALRGELNRVYSAVAQSVAPEVTQKAFDDFHLYDLHRTLALHNTETKQVQFLEASKVNVQRSYQYDGSNIAVQPLYAGYHNDQQFVGSSNTRVSILEEIKNSEANHLGMPLPAGRLRLYRRDTSGQMQFVGESMISTHPRHPRSLHRRVVRDQALQSEGTARHEIR